jgi:hypothetical protein
MRERRKIRALMLCLLFLLSAIGLFVVELNVLGPGSLLPLLVLLVALCAAPALIAWLYGFFDPFEPIYSIALATFIYFGIMVVVLLHTGDFSMLGFDYRDQIPTAVFMASLALAGFGVAYYSTDPKAGQSGNASALTKVELAYAHRRSLFLLGFFGSLFILWIIVGRVPVWSIWIFGGASYGTWNTEAAGAKLGHLYAAQEALPACILLFIASRSKRPWPFAGIMLLGAIAILFAGLGVRARLLLVLGSATAFYYLEKGKKPAAWQIALIALFVFFLIIGAVGYYRGQGNSGSGQDPYRVTNAWDTFVEGSNIATTTALYLRWVPVYGYDLGRDFLQVVVTPIPSVVWPDKYQLFGQSPIEDYRATGAAAAFFVEFYRSFGPVGVVWGMALIGWLCRKVYDTYRANTKNLFAQVSVALLWAYLFHIYGRHSVTLIVYGVAYVFAPVFIMRWLVARRQRTKAPYAEHQRAI